MNEKETSRVIHDFLEAYLKQDVDKTLSFLTEDVVWIQPEGTFKGKNEVKHLLSWLPQSFWWGRMKFRDTGVGILVNGDKAVHEYMIEGVSSEGAGYEARALTWTILAIAVAYAKKRMERQIFAKSTARI